MAVPLALELVVLAAVAEDVRVVVGLLDRCWRHGDEQILQELPTKAQPPSYWPGPQWEGLEVVVPLPVSPWQNLYRAVLWRLLHSPAQYCYIHSDVKVVWQCCYCPHLQVEVGRHSTLHKWDMSSPLT
jgi:hypothetical protein